MKRLKVALVFLAAVLAPIFLTSYLIAQHEQTTATRLSQPHRQVTLPGLLQTWYRYWDKGYLITYGTDGTSEASPTKPAIALYDRNGRVAREGTIWFKDAYSVAINDAAISRSGNTVVGGGTQNEAGVIANFIASIGDDGRMGRVIRTTPFLPVYVCAAEDGTVWSFGIDRDAEGRSVETSPLLRQFSFDKGQIRAMLYKSELNPEVWALVRGRYPGEISFRCTSQKVGLYNAAAGQYVEFDLSANKLKVSKVAPLPSPKEMRVTGFAMTESGGVFASFRSHEGETSRSGIFKLKFDASGLGSWVPLENATGPYLQGNSVERLLGTDGSELIYTRDLDGVAYWSKLADK
jgi:hypothetical protein